MGFGHSLTVTLALQTVLLWQLAALAGRDAVLSRPMIAAIGLATAISGVIAWRFIFPVPALFFALLVGCLGMAYFATFRPLQKELHHG